MKILVLEKEHRISRLIKKYLDLSGYVIDIKQNPKDLIDSATRESYNLIIADKDSMDSSLDAIRLARESGIYTPVLLLSASRKATDRKAEKAAGVDEYLIKPFSVSEIIEKVRKTVGSAPGQSQVLRVGNLSLDTENRVVERAGQRIRLTGKEFSMLEFLMRNQGMPVSKDDIMDYAWDYDADVLPNTVEVYIKYLRTKLEDPFDSKLIHTSRGFGYIIEA